MSCFSFRTKCTKLLRHTFLQVYQNSTPKPNLQTNQVHFQGRGQCDCRRLLDNFNAKASCSKSKGQRLLTADKVVSGERSVAPNASYAVGTLSNSDSPSLSNQGSCKKCPSFRGTPPACPAGINATVSGLKQVAAIAVTGFTSHRL